MSDLPLGTLIAAIRESSSLAGSLKTLKSQFLNKDLTSRSSRGFLKSGLSIPYFSMASLYVILGNLSKSISRVFLKTSRIISVIRFIISSASVKESSMSSCVNSGCLSALRSSSLKHFAN